MNSATKSLTPAMREVLAMVGAATEVPVIGIARQVRALAERGLVAVRQDGEMQWASLTDAGRAA